MAASRHDKQGPDLSAYLDGELPQERAREIERLLAESAECRATLERLRAVSDQLARLPRRRAPDEMTPAMRRHAERRQLLDEKPRAGRGRTLKLVVRVTAAAAVVAACVLVGWQVADRQRPARPGPTLADSRRPDAPLPKDRGFARGEPAPAESETLSAAAKSEVARAEPAEVAARKLGVAIADVPMAPAGTGGGAPAFAAAEGETPLSVEESLAAAQWDAKPAEVHPSPSPTDLNGDIGAPVLGGLHRLDLVPAGPADLAGQPSAEVLITPQSAEQYRAAYALLTDAGREKRATDLYTYGVREPADHAALESVPLQRLQIVRNVPADEFAALIVNLEAQAPQQVCFAMKAANLGLLGSLDRSLAEADQDLTPTAEPPGAGQALETEDRLGERGGVGGRGPAQPPATPEGRVEDEERVKPSSAAELADASREKEGAPRRRGGVAAGGRGRGKSEPARPASPAEARRERRVAPPRKAPVGAAIARSGIPVPSIMPPQEESRQPQSQPTRPPQPPPPTEGRPGAGKAASAAETRTAALSVWTDRIVGYITAEWKRAAQPPSEPPRNAITVRVTLLPPPTSAPQPTTAPAGARREAGTGARAPGPATQPAPARQP